MIAKSKAGRKAVGAGAEYCERVVMTLTPSIMAFFKAKGGGNTSAGCRAVALLAMQAESLEKADKFGA